MSARRSSRVREFVTHAVPVSGKSTWLFVQLILDDGSEGFGEATFEGREPAMLDVLDDLAKRCAGAPLDALSLERLGGFRPSQELRCAIAALEQASLDALSRRADLPLAQLLGAPLRERVPVYANINRGAVDRSPDGIAAKGRAAIAAGYRAIKIAPFDGLRWHQDVLAERHRLLDRGIERVAALRDAIGGEASLMVDCHWRFDIALARRAIDALAPLRPTWVEDPVDTTTTRLRERRALRAHAHAAGMRLAGGEDVWTLEEGLAMLEADAMDVILPDLRQIGVRAGLALLQVAAARGVSTSLHSPVGPVLDAIGLQVASVAPALVALERQVGESPLYDALRIDPAVPEAGEIPLAGRAALDVDREALARHRAVDQRPTSAPNAASFSSDR